MSDAECEACARHAERVQVEYDARDPLRNFVVHGGLEYHHAYEARLRAELAAATDIERLAEAEHEQWMRWAKALLEREPGISQARRERWSKLFVPYAELSEESKEQDRKEVRSALAKATGRILPNHPDAGVK